MVNLKIVRASNHSLQDLPPGLVAVFAGATDGIGLGTLRALARNANAPRAYIIGRSHDKAAHIIDKLKTINPAGSFIFVEGQVSLIHDVDRICEEIKKVETHIDILCMSPGYLNLAGKHDTPEGIETDLALQYYARQRLAYNLASLLELSTSPRVISILAAGFEMQIDPEDLDRRKHYNAGNASLSAIVMTDLMFEELAKIHPNISFIHCYPGMVGTHILDRLLESTPGILWYPAQIPRYTLLPIYRHFLATNPDEAGERILFLATSGRYPASQVHEKLGKVEGFVDRPPTIGSARSTVTIEGNGNGVYRANPTGEIYKDSEILDKYRSEGLGKKVWEHTLGVWEKALATIEGAKEQTEGSFHDSDSLDFEMPVVW